MGTKTRLRPDLLLLLSLLVVILLNPVLDHSDLGKLILGALIFLPVFLSTVRLSQTKSWIWQSVPLLLGTLIIFVASTIFPSRTLLGMKWSLLTAFFALTVVGLFSYLKNATFVTNAHLYTAVSIYLLLGMLWFALYCAIDAFYPGSFAHDNNAPTNRQSELLYFSLVTLSTIGYGDVVPLYGEVRILAALEGMVGVLYIAITVAILIGKFKPHSPSS